MYQWVEILAYYLVMLKKKFNERVLKKTKDPMLAEIANTISQTIQTYRQQLTGAAFTESEAREYNRLFPGIEKSPELNQSLINSLRNQYERNMRLFYERQLGRTGYTKLENPNRGNYCGC